MREMTKARRHRAKAGAPGVSPRGRRVPVHEEDPGRGLLSRPLVPGGCRLRQQSTANLKTGSVRLRSPVSPCVLFSVISVSSVYFVYFDRQAQMLPSFTSPVPLYSAVAG